MKTVAPCNKVALQLLPLAACTARPTCHMGLRPADGGGSAFKPIDLHLLGLVHGGQAQGAARGHEVSGDFGLAVGRDGFAAGQAMHVYGMTLAAKHQLNAVVHLAFAGHPLCHARLCEQI